MPFDLLSQVKPAGLDREGRVRLLDEAANALLNGRLPSRESSMFLGSALSAWLARGGSFERDYLRISAPAGSHSTPAALWREMRDQELASSRGEQVDDDPPILDDTYDDGEQGA